MKKIIVSAMVFILGSASLAFADNWVSVSKYKFDYPVMISGTLQKGQSNVTEPKPVKSEYLQVVAGGAVLIDRGAGLFLRVDLIKKPETKIYFKIEYPNPADPKNPLINDMEYDPKMEGMHFSSPDVIWGLKGYESYPIKVTIYESKGSDKIIDTLTQNVRTYIDTQSPDDVLIFKKVLGNVIRR
jgi:hypothetical protein